MKNLFDGNIGIFLVIASLVGVSELYDIIIDPVIMFEIGGKLFTVFCIYGLVFGILGAMLVFVDEACNLYLFECYNDISMKALRFSTFVLTVIYINRAEYFFNTLIL